MKRLFLAVGIAMAFLTAPSGRAQSAATIVNQDNIVEVAKGGSGWTAAGAGQGLNAGDRIRTGEESRAVVRISDGSTLQLDELTTIEIKVARSGGRETLRLPSGAAYFLNRNGGRELQFETPSANGAIRGTAFLLKVNGQTGETELSMLQGAFELSNQGGSVTAKKGEQAGAATGGAVVKEPLNELGNTAPWYLVIENKLPAVQSLQKIARSEFFKALPASIKQWREVSPQLAGSATIVRREWAQDILRSAFDAVGGGDCALLAKILRSVAAAAPQEASALTQLALALAPQCAGSFEQNKPTEVSTTSQDGGSPNANAAVAPNIAGGGGQGAVVAICHNGQTLFLTPADAQIHLQTHRGDRLGPCQVTPAVNR